MSTPNRYPGICNGCGDAVATRCGVIRRWNGAARAHAPKYAKRSHYGVLQALHCSKCDSDWNNPHLWRII
jgi:hypothetical protein